MARIAVCLEYNAQVVNVIVADGDDPAPNGTFLVPLPDDSLVGPGWTFDGIDFIAPPPEEEPEQVEG